MSSAETSPVRPLVLQATNQAIRMPLVVDCPHSGLAFPRDAASIAPADSLLASWDAYADRLMAATPEVGGTLIAASFHRAYIDPNRDEADIDPSLLCEPLPKELVGCRVVNGSGLIRRWAQKGVPMYDRLLTASEVGERIAKYYKPYHEALATSLEAAVAQFGAVWHLNCHSMRSEDAVAGRAGRPDVVICDASCTTAAPEFGDWVARAWRNLGYTVGINSPYSGGSIIRRYGAPRLRRYSIQMMFNRSLYMNEETLEPHAGIERLEDDVRVFLIQLRQHIDEVCSAQRFADACQSPEECSLSDSLR